MNEEFLKKVEFYKEEAKNGNYHNPYGVNEELDLLIDKNLHDGERVKSEDVAHETGMLFWSM